MRANAWRKFLDDQRERHRKILFTVTELANVAGTSGAALNVELTRLRQQGLLAKYAHGLYGPPGAVTPEALLPAIDAHAYITGHYSLFVNNLVTQVPSLITCITDRRSPRARLRNTPVGRLLLVCVRGKIYVPPCQSVIAGPVQALCDFVYLCRRQGVRPEGLVTFRNLGGLRGADFAGIVGRYPVTVQRHVGELVGDASFCTR
jgi:hypothetical protein